MFRKLYRELFPKMSKVTRKRDFEWERFQATAKDQFLRLKEKGLSIPVVTL